jgi:flagellar protein FlgJ
MINANLAATVLANSQDHNARQTSAVRTAAITKGAAMNEAQINSVSQDFEAMFVAQMLSQMFGDSVGNSLFGDEQSKEIYQSLIVDEYGKRIASAGGIGIASFVKRELLALQEVQS